ncbi:MAG: hypothetical protein JWN86_87 [Planctomycetota bacterium]|nr:hypothetical protein [Planctomycetota bacterium]
MTAGVLIVSILAIALPADDSSMKIDANKVVNRISPLMYGSCIEDVNHEIYGGLYAQMIFGESFEEPPRSIGPAGWTAYGGQWKADASLLSVASDFGAKIVRDGGIITDATVSCDVRLTDDRGDNAGLILRVNDPRPGADSWIGYEISISAKHQFVLLGRHKNNFTLLKTQKADITPGRWYRLSARMKGAEIQIHLDDAKEPVITFSDDANAITSGRVGLRTWGSNAEYRNLVIEKADGKTADAFAPRTGPGFERHLSGMWDVIRTGDAVPELAWDEDRPYNTAHSQRIERRGESGTVGIANRGLNRWGLNFRAGHAYAGRLFLRQEGYQGAVTVALQSADGRRTYASQTLEELDKDWTLHEFALTPDATDSNARFAVWIDRPGKVWVDQVFLSGTGEELFAGLPFRGDIARSLQQQGLTLLRYGGSMVNAPEYRWKTMIGDRDKRPQYKGWWYSQSTNGFGIEEFVQFCRAAGFEAVVSINIEETPQDAADLVEYFNGPATSEWGRKRAANGHPAPYALKYLQIGNEETTNAHYIERFKLLYEAMRPRDESVQYIIGAWWEPDNPISKRIVQELSGKASLWDVHVGGDDPREGAKVDALFTRMRKLYEDWSPGTTLKACVLEENGGRHNIQRALGHAGVLNATQRHGDFVLIDCPANCLQPWKQNDNDWDQGQLFFTSSQVWGMPPYYAQQMAASSHQPLRIASSVKSPGNDLDLTATRDEAGKTLILKVVNVGEASHRTEITVEGGGTMARKANVLTLSGNLNDINTPEAPDRIRSLSTQLEVTGDRFSYEFAARSYTILRIPIVRAD